MQLICWYISYGMISFLEWKGDNDFWLGPYWNEPCMLLTHGKFSTCHLVDTAFLLRWLLLVLWRGLFLLLAFRWWALLWSIIRRKRMMLISSLLSWSVLWILIFTLIFIWSQGPGCSIVPNVLIESPLTFSPQLYSWCFVFSISHSGTYHLIPFCIFQQPLCFIFNISVYFVFCLAFLLGLGQVWPPFFYSFPFVSSVVIIGMSHHM